MFSSGIPLDVNLGQFANLLAEKRSKCCYCFQVANRPSLLESTTSIIHPAQHKNRSVTNRRLFRVLRCFEVLGGFGNAYFVSFCGLHGTPVGLSDCFCADNGTEINKASGDFKTCFAHRTIELSSKFAYTSIVYCLSMQIFQEARGIEARAQCFRTAG